MDLLYDDVCMNLCDAPYDIALMYNKHDRRWEGLRTPPLRTNTDVTLCFRYVRVAVRQKQKACQLSGDWLQEAAVSLFCFGLTSYTQRNEMFIGLS